MDPAPTIETARLSLRRPERRKVTFYARQAQEAYAARAEPLSRDQARSFAAFMVEHWDRYGFGFLVLDTIDDVGKPMSIGHAGFKYVDASPTHWPETYDAIELGYSVVPSARGQGYVTEAARALLTAAFAAFDVASIRAKCRHDNSKSAAVLLRCGMKELPATETWRQFEIAR